MCEEGSHREEATDPAHLLTEGLPDGEHPAEGYPAVVVMRQYPTEEAEERALTSHRRMNGQRAWGSLRMTGFTSN